LKRLIDGDNVRAALQRQQGVYSRLFTRPRKRGTLSTSVVSSMSRGWECEHWTLRVYW